MKKMFSKMWAMAMCLLIVSCSSEGDGIINDDNQVVCFVATISDVSTRVAYDDVNDYLKVSWEVGDEVVLSNGVDDYTFHVTKVNDDRSAQLSYAGPIDNATNFTGTATYAPWGNSAVQKANGNTEHLKYGEKMVATLSRVNLTTSPRVNFSHPETAVYKILYKVPEDCAAGSSLGMSGAWGEDVPTVFFDFPLVKNEVLTAYIIAQGGSVSANASLNFVFTLPKSENSVSTTIGGDEYHYSVEFSKTFTYAVGKYWIADVRFLPLKYQAVDLGVGDVKWATCNVGATSPEAEGQYYSWGDLIASPDPHSFQQIYGLWSWESYQRTDHADWTDEESTNDTWFGTNGYGDDVIWKNDPTCTISSIIGTQYDIAYMQMGKGWKMPSVEDFQIIIDNCSMTEISENSQSCLKITGKDNHYIILPMAGYKTSAKRLSSVYHAQSSSQLSFCGYDLISGCHYWTGESSTTLYYSRRPDMGYDKARAFGNSQIETLYKYVGMPVRGVKK